VSDGALRIALNAIFLEQGMGGLEAYVRELTPRLARLSPPGSSVTVLCNRSGRELLGRQSWAGEVELLVPPFPTGHGFRALSELTFLGGWASRNCDALLSPALTAPWATRAANVVVMADVTWLLFPDLGDGAGATLRLWRTIVPPVARRADRVIALTEVGASELVARFGLARDRIDVIGLGFDQLEEVQPTPDRELRDRFGLGSSQVVLNVAAKKAHKNQVALVEAVARLVGEGRDIRLMLPGARTPYEDQIREQARLLGIEDRVVLPGFVGDEDLEGLYALSACLAFPSLNEGFGLPLLEAMARDLPVVCSRASVMPEVVGDAAELVDPTDPDSIAAGIDAIISDPERAAVLTRAGRLRAAEFSWDSVAGQTLASLEKAVLEKQVKQ
jgi:glycosyltransferase involved in cell wall biosynthesis